MNEDQIRQQQLLLIQKGFLSGSKNPDGTYVEVDGKWGPRTQNAYDIYLKSSENKPKLIKRQMDFRDIKQYEQNVNTSKSNVDIINYYHQVNQTNTPYLIDDKKNDKLYVCINGNIIKSFPAIHGKYSTTFGNTFNKKVKTDKKEYIVKEGDILSKIAKDNNITLDKLVRDNNIKDYNKIYVNQKLIINSDGFTYQPNTKIDPDEATITYRDSKGKLINLAGNLTTPAGIYFTSRSGIYEGAPSFIRRTQQQVQSNNPDGIPSSIHVRTIKENANTNGCTGLSKESLKELDRMLSGYNNIPTYILPANSKNKFVIRNGELQFSSHDITKTPSHNTINTSPIKKIVINPQNLNDDQKKILTDFAQALSRNKIILQKELGLNNDTYNQLAAYAIGILGVESNYGQKNSWIGNVARGAKKLISKSDNSSPDIYAKYNGISLLGLFNVGRSQENYNSIGLTQIRFSNLGNAEKELFKKFNITKESLVNNSEKAAIATMIKLATEFKNQGHNMDKAIRSWNKRDNYITRVKKASERVKFLQDYKYIYNMATKINKYGRMV